MRRLGGAGFSLLLILLASPACKRKSVAEAPAGQTQDTAQLVSVVRVNDHAVSSQLVRGFYPLEANAWRWTMQKFTVALKPPAGAAQSGARLSLKFTIPEAICRKVGPMQLSANINGLALPPETYSMPGDYIYTRDVPANALSGDAVSVDFSTDKAMPPSPQDNRQLALIAVSISLEAK